MPCSICHDEGLRTHANNFVDFQRRSSCRWNPWIWKDASFSLDNINSLAPVVAEVPGCWGWFDCESPHVRETMLFSTVFQHFAKMGRLIFQHFFQKNWNKLKVPSILKIGV